MPQPKWLRPAPRPPQSPVRTARRFFPIARVRVRRKGNIEMAGTESQQVVEDSNGKAESAAQDPILRTANQEAIAALAYDFWIQRGCPKGNPEVDWFRAKEELESRNSD